MFYLASIFLYFLIFQNVIAEQEVSLRIVPKQQLAAHRMEIIENLNRSPVVQFPTSKRFSTKIFREMPILEGNPQLAEPPTPNKWKKVAFAPFHFPLICIRPFFSYYREVTTFSDLLF